jgi:hypothetical protein
VFLRVWGSELTCEVLSGTMGLAGAEVPFGAAFEDVSAFEEALWVDVIFVLTTRRFLDTPVGAGMLCFSFVLEVSDRESSTPVRGRCGAIQWMFRISACEFQVKALRFVRRSKGRGLLRRGGG